MNTSIMLNPRPGGKPLVPPRNSVEVDLAFFVDPVAKRLWKVRMRSYTKVWAGGGLGLARVAVGGVPRAQEEEEEDVDPKTAAAAPLLFKDGLPQRKKPAKEQWTTATVDLRLDNHGNAKVPDLSAEAKTLLGLPATK